MRLRPFTPNAPIPDIDEDPNLFFADPDASDDQELSNDHIPQLSHFEPTPETVEREEFDTEHGIIYYEQAQRLTDRPQLQLIPENFPQTVEQPLDDSVVRTNTNDEYRVQPDGTAADDNKLTNNNIRTQVTSRNNITCYLLRSEPNPETYRDITNSKSNTPY